MGTNNLTSCTNTSSGKQPRCQPIYWKDKTKEQVNTHDFVNEEVQDEPQETSTYTHETFNKACSQSLAHLYVGGPCGNN